MHATMANILHIQRGDWNKIQESDKPVLIDFWAEWCAPCHMMAPTFERLAEKYSDAITFAKVDVDALPELANQFGIRSIPTLLLVRGGTEAERLIGVRPEGEVAQVLDQYADVPLKNRTA
jgi:thioredoxin 1